MSKIYNRSNIEQKAKELLSPIQVACPDNLWQQLDYRLNENYGENEKRWKNNLYSPKTLLFALSGILIIGILAWRLLPLLTNRTYNQTVIVPVKPPQTVAVKVEPPIVKPVTAVTNKDSIAKVKAKDSIAKLATATPATTGAVALNSAPTPAIDMNARMAYFARRDSLRRIRLLSLTAHKDSAASGAKSDTVARIHPKTMSMRHDSTATSAVKDSAN